MEPTEPLSMPGGTRDSHAADTKSSPLPAVRSIRTMQSDIMEAIETQRETAASIALAEERKREWAQAAALAAKQEEAAQVVSAQPIAKPRGRLILVVVFVLVLAIAVGIAYKFLAPEPRFITVPLLGDVNIGKPTPQAPVVAPVVTPASQLNPALITPQSEKHFVLASENPDHVSASILVERTAGLAPGTIKNLFFSEQSSTQNTLTNVSISRLLSFMRVPAPDYVLRSINPTFMLGLLGGENFSVTPFLILKTSDADASRAALLSWEQSMPHDIGILFAQKIEVAGTPVFRDAIVVGFDARILNTQPEMSLSYAFVDKNTVVIAGTQATLADILTRLAKK